MPHRCEIVTLVDLEYYNRRKRAGVEPARDRSAAPTGFEVRPTHRGRFSSVRPVSYRHDSWAMKAASSSASRHRQSSISRPRATLPITGRGRPRRRVRDILQALAANGHRGRGQQINRERARPDLAPATPRQRYPSPAIATAITRTDPFRASPGYRLPIGSADAAPAGVRQDDPDRDTSAAPPPTPRDVLCRGAGHA